MKNYALWNDILENGFIENNLMNKSSSCKYTYEETQN